MPADRWKHVLYSDDGRLRGGWRIGLWLAAFLGLLLIGSLLLPMFGVLDPTAAELTPAALFWPGAVALVAATGAGWWMLDRHEDRPRAALGFAWTSHSPREIGVGLLIGAGVLGVVVGFLALTGWLDYRPDEGNVATYAAVVLGHLLLLAVPAAAEEAIFRGYPFQVAVESIGAFGATVIFSAAFALAHTMNPNANLFALVNIFLAGVLLSIAYLRTRSLWFATAVHLGWNWSLASLFDLPVSGLEFFDTPLYEPNVPAPDWVMGGGFGPEAGLVATIAAALGLTAVVRWPGLDEAPEMRKARPLVDERLGDGSGDGPNASLTET